MTSSPLYFGPDRELYGVFHAATTSADWAVVCCPPAGQESIRSHRARRLLADRMAETGADVLRFDFFGTGDSAGGDRDGTPERWVEDVRIAAAKARELSGARRFALVGMRLGALLGLRAEVRAVSRVILWDPVVDAPGYLAEMESRSETTPDGTWMLDGLPLTNQVRAQLEHLDLTDVGRIPRDVRITVSDGNESGATVLAALGARVKFFDVSTESPWTELGTTGAGAIDHAVLRHLAEGLTGS